MNKWMEGKAWKTNRHASFPEINKTVWEWFQEARSRDELLTRAVVRQKALEIATQLGYKKFCASSTWLDKWSKQHDVKLTPEKNRPVKKGPGGNHKVNSAEIKDFE